MFKKIIAVLAMGGFLMVAPIGCTKSQFISTTDRIGESLATVNKAYGVVEVMLEKALRKNLPGADLLAVYLNWLKAVRDEIANGLPENAEDVAFAEKAADVAMKYVVPSAEEMVE